MTVNVLVEWPSVLKAADQLPGKNSTNPATGVAVWVMDTTPLISVAVRGPVNADDDKLRPMVAYPRGLLEMGVDV